MFSPAGTIEVSGLFGTATVVDANRGGAGVSRHSSYRFVVGR